MTNLTIGAWALTIAIFYGIAMAIKFLGWAIERSGFHALLCRLLPMQNKHSHGVDLYRAQGYTLKRAKAIVAQANR